MRFFAGILFKLSMLVAPLLAIQPAVPLPAESIAYRRSQLASPDLRPENKPRSYARYDFSPLWMESNRDNGGPYGIIGLNCQRLRMKILTIARDGADPALYYFTGKTQVAGHLSAFSSVLRLQEVHELGHLDVRVDEVVSPAKKEGIALGVYEFREDVSQLKTGVFRGVVKTNWYLDKRGRLRYDDIRLGDGYCNNQFVGAWTSYTTKKTLRCNWGDYRIPNSGNFDIGAGDFSPNPKYYAYGWQNFKEINSGKSPVEQERANRVWRKRENSVWWK